MQARTDPYFDKASVFCPARAFFIAFTPFQKICIVIRHNKCTFFVKLMISNDYGLNVHNLLARRLADLYPKVDYP
jgi:hypothetical protein